METKIKKNYDAWLEKTNQNVYNKTLDGWGLWLDAAGGHFEDFNVVIVRHLEKDDVIKIYKEKGYTVEENKRFVYFFKYNN